ncbi:MAG: tetraacyldisaccharide 4'-kinase [Pseudomonadota bacterium]|nr:tetraacyldisaccharide 4'-kinase [Pseudomonadota bacterium]MDP1905292.1 tetraacyldisaccharide 4'-kinase [Pseudomonadota bacterium]MDP2353844.1 tetraacyldisaccharide 4'-kinase [Pseudomonadota bacterium]
MKAFLERCWYGDCRYRFPLLLLSQFFFLLLTLRRLAYRAGLLKTRRLPVPVIVVGNLSVGGSGKTPLTLRIAQWLTELGYHPGIISRGYGGHARAPMLVRADSDPAMVGDEPLLLARRAACPVWIGRKRAEAGRQLLAAHPGVDVLVTDDGLQHYALARDMEIVVVDGVRGFGNGRLLPAGPLREPLGRLATVDAAVVNGGDPDDFILLPPSFAMRLRGATFRNLLDPARTAVAADFAGREIHALAGIGHPQRFFEHLAQLGVLAIPLAFPDHHVYTASDLPGGTLLMTEKDAVKCADFASPDAWFLAVDAELEPGLKTLIDHTLKVCHGSKTA